MKRILSLIISVALLISTFVAIPDIFAATDEILDNPQVEVNDELGAAKACDGHVLGTVSGVPACVNENGELHVCENNFPDENFRKYIDNWVYVEDGYWPENKINLMNGVSLSFPSYSEPNSEPIYSMKGIEFFNKVENIFVYGNQLTKLDVSNNLE